MNSNSQSPETRHSLLLRLRNPDDMMAWKEFVEIYQPLIHSLALRRGLQKADADDVTQEVMTRVAKSIGNWDVKSENSSFRAWLATITKNQTFQFFRERKRRPTTGIDTKIGQTPDELQDSEFDLEHDRQLFAWAARRVQSRFESKTWKVFWRTAVEEKTIKETARELQISESQIYVARSRVMNALKLAVEKSGFESRDDWRMS